VLHVARFARAVSRAAGHCVQNGAYGKPDVLRSSALRFNMSTSAGVSAIASGSDIEEGSSASAPAYRDARPSGCGRPSMQPDC
jgi:hypothetical protein